VEPLDRDAVRAHRSEHADVPVGARPRRVGPLQGAVEIYGRAEAAGVDLALVRPPLREITDKRELRSSGYGSRSGTKIERRQDQRKLYAFRTGFVTPPILAGPVETFRPTLLLRHAAEAPPAVAVVATDTASVDADRDNGAGLRGACGARRDDDRATRRIE
jgi:hypothetical protein